MTTTNVPRCTTGQRLHWKRFDVLKTSCTGAGRRVAVASATKQMILACDRLRIDRTTVEYELTRAGRLSMRICESCPGPICYPAPIMDQFPRRGGYRNAVARLTRESCVCSLYVVRCALWLQGEIRINYAGLCRGG